MTRTVTKSMVASFHVQPSGRSVTEALQKSESNSASHKTTVAQSLRELESLQWPVIARKLEGPGRAPFLTLLESASRAVTDTMTNRARLRFGNARACLVLAASSVERENVGQGGEPASCILQPSRPLVQTPYIDPGS